MTTEVQPHGTIVCDLGEGPLWCPRSRRLYWHDVTGRCLHRSDMDGTACESFALGRIPGNFGLRVGGGLLAVWRNGISLFDPDSAVEQEISGHGIDFATERFNDGACDARGRYWTGSFDPSMATAGGGLYRIDPDRTVHRMDDGIAMANGLAWSPDGTLLYFADSRPGRVYRYRFDMERGSVGDREVFLDYGDRPGRPDGCTVDSEGCLWVAEVTAGRVSRYAPDGRLVRRIDLPVSKPTSVAFGGPALRTLFITTMRYGLDPAQSAAEPLAGRLLRLEVDVPGLEEARFAG